MFVLKSRHRDVARLVSPSCASVRKKLWSFFKSGLDGVADLVQVFGGQSERRPDLDLLGGDLGFDVVELGPDGRGKEQGVAVVLGAAYGGFGEYEGLGFSVGG